MVRNGGICWKQKRFVQCLGLGLQYKRQKIGVTKSVIKCVNSFFLSAEFLCTISHSKISKFSTLAGVPQGSLTALFLVVISGIPNSLAQNNRLANDFDHSYMSYSRRKIVKWNSIFTRQIVQMEWKTKKIGPGKNKLLIFFKKALENGSRLDHFIDGKQIKGASSIKLIAVTLTPHLHWNEHCKSLLARANKSIYQLWRLSQINIDD